MVNESKDEVIVNRNNEQTIHMLLGLKSLNIYTCPRFEPLNNNDIRSEDQNIRVFDDHFQAQISVHFETFK